MTTLTRLSTLSSTTNDLFDRADPPKQAAAVAVACREAAQVAGVISPDLEAVIRGIESGETEALGKAFRLDIESRRDAADDNYLNAMDDDALASDASRQFSTARALSAIIFALQPTPLSFKESIYEAVMALPHPENLLSEMNRILGQSKMV